MKKTGTGPTSKKFAQPKKSRESHAASSRKTKKLAKLGKTSDLPIPDDEENQAKPESAFPIIALGASAGGLEAFETFFKNMPEDSGVAFVLISHLDPAHTSMMKELMSKYTKMKVCQVEDGMKLEPNSVYVIPPNRYMSVHDDTLQLSEPEDPRGLRMPIDFFLRSLAADQGERAICVILSGTGSDGTLGLRAIHGGGGISIVQDPTTAKYSGMPQNAIDTGLADYVLPPEKIPAQLLSYIQHTYPRRKKQEDIYRQRAGTTLQKILNLIRQQTGHDFSFYKKNTINRRIERRMNVLEIEDDTTYLRFLQEHPEEVKLLFKEMLINVTSFFRDKEGFQALKERVLPELLMSRPPGYLRVWVPGCATGEEVYSLCIVMREVMDTINRDFKMQIFGTDIDEESITMARAGLYPNNIAIDVSPERLKKFFIKDDSGFRVKKEIRESVVFAVQNVIKDAPFTKMDLISCRNLLIYMDSQLQNKVLPLFHFSLLPGGVLFLGSSESIGGFVDLFSIVDKKWKIFRRRESASAVQSTLLQGLPWTFEPHRERRDKAIPMQEISISDIVRKFLLDHYTPSSVIIDEKGEIVYIHGRTGNYLEPAPGKAALNIFDMAREGLRMELRTAVHQAKSFSREVRCNNLRVKTNGDHKIMDLTVKPLTDVEHLAGLLMIIVEETGEPKKDKTKSSPKADKETKNISELQEELRYTRSSLQATIEEAQASNEELKSANEELQSTNEELQSTNEELETSKEELQSVNEELITVNSELQAKIEQLSRTESDLKYLLDSTNIGIIFLEEDLKIKRFTREVTKYINLIPSDIGRPLSDIAINLDINLMEESKKVIETLAFKELEVKTKEAQWLLVRIMPFRNTENIFDGLVLTFTDINVMKQDQQLLGEFGDISLLLDNVPQGFALSGPDGNIKFINRHGRALIGRFESVPHKMSESEEVKFWRFYRDGRQKPSYDELPLTRVIQKGEDIKNEKWHICRDGKDIAISCDGRPIRDSKGIMLGGILTFKEIY